MVSRKEDTVVPLVLLTRCYTKDAQAARGPTRVHHGTDAIDGDRSLSDVGGDDNLTPVLGGICPLKGCPLLVPIQSAVQGHTSCSFAVEW